MPVTTGTAGREPALQRTDPGAHHRYRPATRLHLDITESGALGAAAPTHRASRREEIAEVIVFIASAAQATSLAQSSTATADARQFTRNLSHRPELPRRSRNPDHPFHVTGVYTWHVSVSPALAGTP
jgi:hypothetical protein